MKFFWKFLAFIMGRNIAATPVDTIISQLNEPRPLPLGRQEFQEWSDRIINGAMLTAFLPEEDYIFREGQRFSLATMILHLGPTESHKEDAFFIHSLRKAAANQVAHTLAQEIKLEGQKRHAEAAAKAKAEEDAKALKIVPAVEEVTQAQEAVSTK
jgi:hypothetical protein